MALSDTDIRVLYADETGFILNDSPAALLDFARAIEAEVRKQDDALILQLVEALEYHRAQTRPIDRTDEAITAGRARLGRPHD